jgi:DNA mismatch repair ATPase MutS
MGGKSTYLRAAGLTVILAQMGCFVPCDSARFSVFVGIHTRVGASDYQCLFYYFFINVVFFDVIFR